MSGYRDKQTLREWLLPADRWSLSFIAARLGFGLLAIGLFGLLTDGSLILFVPALLIGAISLAYGLRS